MVTRGGNSDTKVTKVPKPSAWQPATVVSIREETHRVKTIRFTVNNWPGHLAGQHADVRLTAEDGYRAERSYSIASPPEVSALELTVERLEEGEVSPFLTDQLQPDDTIQLRGPIGGHFTWSALERRRPLLLLGRRERDCAAYVHAAAPAIVRPCGSRRAPLLGPHPRRCDLPRRARGSRTQRSPIHASDHADARFCAGLDRRSRALRSASHPNAAARTRWSRGQLRLRFCRICGNGVCPARTSGTPERRDSHGTVWTIRIVARRFGLLLFVDATIR